MKSRSSNAVSPGRARSFTLIEVLITVGILSTVIIFILRSFMTLLSSVRFSQDLTFACYLAKDRLWKIEQARSKGILASASGTEELGARSFAWSYEIIDFGDPDLRQLTLKISWKKKESEKEYTTEFTTYVKKEK